MRAVSETNISGKDCYFSGYFEIDSGRYLTIKTF